MPRVTAAQAVAFRVAAHNLGARLPGGWLAEATALSPLQDTAPPAGAGLSLAARAADVTLKEQRKLVVVPRESPLNKIHLRNMTTLADCGAVLIPPMLSFYLPDFGTIEGQINYTIGKVMDQFGIEHDLYTRWGQHKTPAGV